MGNEQREVVCVQYMTERDVPLVPALVHAGKVSNTNRRACRFVDTEPLAKRHWTIQEDHISQSF